MRGRIISFLLSRYGESDLAEAGIETHRYVSPRDLHMGGESNEPYATRPRMDIPTVPPDMGKAVRSTGALREVLARTREANAGRYEDWLATRDELIIEYERAMRLAVSPHRWRQQCAAIQARNSGGPLFSGRQAYQVSLGVLALVVGAILISLMLAGYMGFWDALPAMVLFIGSIAVVGWQMRREDPAVRLEGCAARCVSRWYFVRACWVAALVTLMLLVWLALLVAPVINRALLSQGRTQTAQYPYVPPRGGGNMAGSSYDPSLDNGSVLTDGLLIDELLRLRTRFKLEEGIDNRGPVFERLALGVGHYRFEPQNMPPELLERLLGPPDWVIDRHRVRGFAYWYRDQRGIASVIAFTYIGDHAETVMMTNVEETLWDRRYPFYWTAVLPREWPDEGDGF